ncbi:MAG TPA: thiamine phosphate synthase [bacterium]|nr:thiamine phosphate synthase [bacterium]
MAPPGTDALDPLEDLGPEDAVQLPRLMLITDPGRTGGRPLLKVVELALKGGVRMVQLRAKGLPDLDFYLLARQVTHLVHAFGGISIINDRIDICHAVGAEGVHLGDDDLPVRVARHLLGPSKLLGYSAHSLKELRRKPEEGADYLTFSPIYPLSHKPSPTPPWGPEGYREALLGCKVPVFALGGITLEGLPVLVETAAGCTQPPRVAAVSLLSEAERIIDRSQEVLRALHPEGVPDSGGGLEGRYTFDPEDLLSAEDYDPGYGADAQED